MLKAIREWIQRRRQKKAERAAQQVRHIPQGYFSGYRRLASTAAEVRGQHCWNCRHAIAYVTWHCDLQAYKDGPGCKWQSCYVADQLTKADLEAGGKDTVLGRWIDLPPQEK